MCCTNNSDKWNASMTMFCTCILLSVMSHFDKYKLPLFMNTVIFYSNIFMSVNCNAVCKLIWAVHDCGHIEKKNQGYRWQKFEHPRLHRDSEFISYWEKSLRNPKNQFPLHLFQHRRCYAFSNIILFFCGKFYNLGNVFIS